MILTMENKERQKMFRSRKLNSGLKEIRGLFCPADKHDEFKEKFKKELEK